MNQLEIFLGTGAVGTLSHLASENRFSVEYLDAWQANPAHFGFSPHLPVAGVPEQTPEAHSAAVRNFFENLLPEGRSLDDAAATHKVSRSNVFALIAAMGRETTGALSLRMPAPPDVTATQDTKEMRSVSKEELSARIRSRPYEPFSVWDGKVRLSIAGFQDKLSVFESGDSWYLVDGPDLASTAILKPEPVGPPKLEGLTSNEFFCMRLAASTGLPVANVRLAHVPEPVLVVDRFDRVTEEGVVKRLHVIDGCQLLGIGPSMKYERPYGSGAAVAKIRDGASLPALFKAIKVSPTPAAQRLFLLRWAIVHILMGDTDAHAKNISFFYDEAGLRMAPMYDIVSILALADGIIEDSYAMAIGDAFREAELSAFEWAYFAHQCELPPQLVARELGKLSTALLENIDRVRQEVLADGALPAAVDSVCRTVSRLVEAHRKIAPEIPEVDPEAFQ